MSDREEKISIQIVKLTSRVDEMSRKIDDNALETNEKLDKIQEQTTKTNGRVSTLENWRWFIIGGLTIISLVVIPLLYLLYKLNP